jgi:hypothetical protein
MSVEVTGARRDVLVTLCERLDRAGEGLGTGSAPLDGGYEQARHGAGQFTGMLDGGAGEFVTSWVGVLEVCGTSSSLISSGVWDFLEGLRGVDRRSSRAVIAL